MSFSLYRHLGSPYWNALFRTPDTEKPGKLTELFKSTKATDKRKAKEKARKVEDDIEKAVFTTFDLQQLLAATEGSWKGVILFGYYVGANLRDITNLRWSQIDLAEGAVSYSRQRTVRAVTVPLHGQLQDWLVNIDASDDPKAFVFPDLAGQKLTSHSSAAMNAVYTHHELETLRAAVNTVPEICIPTD